MHNVILHTVNLCKSFGGLRVLDGVTLKLQRSEIRAVIGPNGAGKSTLLNLLSGEIYPDQGTILFEGRSLAGLRPHQRASLGLARTFQISNLFEELTVGEAVRAALVRGRLRSADEEKLRSILARFDLTEIAQHRAKELSHGKRRLVELALAISQQPKLCLLDEPTAGLSARETNKIVQLLLDLKAAQQTLLVVEHDMAVVHQLADSVTVLHQGRVLAEGTPQEVGQDEHVQQAYSFIGDRECWN